MKHKKMFVIITSIVLLMTVTVLTLVNLVGKSVKKNSGCTGGGCSGCNGCGQGTINSAYYTSKEKQLLETLNERQKAFVNILKDSNTEQEISTITKETKEEFIRLIPQIPYIGGDGNDLTEDIEQAAMVLAFYRVEKKYGKSADDVGKIVYTAIRAEMAKYPKWLMRWNGGKYFTNTYIKKMRSEALSQKKQYPGGWVSEFVEGDGKTFDYGFNHTECGIVKYFKQQDAAELTPYLCQLDFVYSEYLDEGLVRTSTLAQGGSYCDFRYKRVDNWQLDMMMLGVACMIAVIVLSVIALIIRKIFLIRRRRRIHESG